MFPFNQYPYINVNDLNLDWIIIHFKEFIEELASLDSWRNEHKQEYQELKNMIDKLYHGNLSPEFVAAIKTWLYANIQDIVGEMVKSVFFGLTDDGYFVAYIPESWNEIVFNTTGYDITVALQPNYGHLVLSY